MKDATDARVKLVELVNGSAAVDVPQNAVIQHQLVRHVKRRTISGVVIGTFRVVQTGNSATSCNVVYLSNNMNAAPVTRSCHREERNVPQSLAIGVPTRFRKYQDLSPCQEIFFPMVDHPSKFGHSVSFDVHNGQTFKSTNFVHHTVEKVKVNESLHHLKDTVFTGTKYQCNNINLHQMYEMPIHNS